MRRILEFGIYAVVILYFIVKYSTVDIDAPRRSPPSQLPPSIMLPDNAVLPRENADIVEVTLETERHSGVGTAFVIDDIGTFVTARHVVDDCDNVYFLTANQRLENVSSVRSETTRDFAVIQSRRRITHHLRLADYVPKRGDEGFMMGYPKGKPADVRATVIGRTQMRSNGRYRMREPVIAWVERERRPGFSGSLGGISGGPVFDANGDIVGTVVAGAPRRGRIYTTHPRVFDETGLAQNNRRGSTKSFPQGITKDNFSIIGQELRNSGAIAQVYCKVN